jgi:DNA repair exonuclease SbcCD nuclease subunit
MVWLLTSDLHLTDRPRDEYRWGLFPWLAKQQDKCGVTATFIAGDITQDKDKHSATLVNRMVDELIGLKPPIYILTGNHDYIRRDNPYFRFLSTIDGVHFVTEPTLIGSVAMIPHQPDQASLDSACRIAAKAQMALGHQCISGAIAETGRALTGLAWPLAGSKALPLGTFLGDIHRPQRLENGVTYIGSPYPIRFGDDFTPRVLLLKNGKEQNLYYPSPRKWVLTVRDEDEILNNEDLHKGDQVRITVEMTREEVCEWNTHRQRVLAACKELGLEVYGCELKVNTSERRERSVLKTARSPEDVLASFCKAENVSSAIKKAGIELIKG